VNCILLTDGFRPPFGGISRYTREILLRLYGNPAVESVQCLEGGRFVEPDVVLTRFVERSRQVAEASNSPSFRFRVRLGGLTPVAKLYEYSRMFRGSARLRRMQESTSVVHGPSFFVPVSHLPTVVTIHDLSVYFHPESHPATRVERVKKMIGEAIKREYSIIVDADSTKKEAVEVLNANPELVSVVPLGVDDSFHPRSPDQLTRVLSKYALIANGYLLSVATLEPRKNITRLIRAYASFPMQERRACPLVLVGAKGWKESPLVKEILNGQNEGWIKLLGEVSEAELPFIFSGAKAFVYVSLYEGFGLPLLEAMASGVPVLSSNTSAMPEVLGGAGLIVDPFDVAAIADGLERLLGDRVWRIETTAAGLLRARGFTWERAALQTLAVYRGAIDRHH
jgi:glycosyltransferase involved in cell wall biosynthesis